MNRRILLTLGLSLTTLGIAMPVTGCRRAPAPATADHHDEDGHDERDGHGDHQGEAAASGNRVAIPANVRQNLGMTFARVERRAVARTLRVPGAFELLPTATREYRAAAAGRVELLVAQHARVTQGQPIARIDSPRLREVQQQLAEASASLALARAAVESLPPFFEAHEKHHAEIERTVALWTERVEQLGALRTAGGGQAAELATANAALAQARADFAETLEKEAELLARRSQSDAQLAAARQRLDLLLATMASLTGTPAAELAQPVSDGGSPAWQAATAIEVRAAAPGVVAGVHVTPGAYVEASAPLLTIIAPDGLRFRARGYQSDLGRLADGLPATVVAPGGAIPSDAAPMAGPLAIAPEATTGSRTIDLFVTPAALAPWARAGVAGFLEITLAGSAEATPDLAVPRSSVVRDGLTPVLFRRDPRDPDRVIRLEADVGTDDGRWVAIQSGVAEGDEVVLDGAYQLLVATSGTIQKGGHFHPDGSFHAGEEGEE